MQDIQEIIFDGNPEDYYIFSDKLFLKEFTYDKLFYEIRLMPYMKKFFLYIIHYYNSFKGENEMEHNNNIIFKKPIKSLKEIYERNEIIEQYNHLLYYNDDRMTYELYNMGGYSRDYKLHLKWLDYILKDKYLEIYISKKKLLVSKCLNNYLSDDLLESICEHFLTRNDINKKKNIKENIKISVQNTKRYYIDNNINYNNSFCINWRYNYGIYGYYLPEIEIIKYFQILPFIFNHEEKFDDCSGDCDYCDYKIDYPRKMYLYFRTLNKLRGSNSNFYNNWIIFIYNLCCTPGRSISRSGFISIYNRTNKNYKKNGFKKYKSHPILKNNISNWKQLENIWEKVRYND